MAKSSKASRRTRGRRRRARRDDRRAPIGQMLGAFVALAGVNTVARIAFLVLLSVALFLPGQFALGPSDRDEARFAQASKQMLESGDYVDIRFQESERHKKPAGIYWLQAGFAAIAGGAEAEIWAYRSPSLIGAILAVVATVWALRPLVGPRAAFLAAAMTAGMVLLNVEARIAKTDAALLAATVAAMGALARLWFQSRDDPREHGWNVFFFWTALAIGVLLKGPIILLPVLAVIVWMVIQEVSFAGLGRLGAAWGLVWFLLIAAPWHIAIGVQTDGAFFQAALGEDLLSKVTESKEAHGAPPGFYLGAFWGSFWPWTPMALLAIPWIWRWRASPEVAFMFGWIAPTWLVFEIAGTKLPHYVLIVYPAIAALAAACALDGTARPRGLLFWVGAVLWAVPAIALPAAIGLAPLLTAGVFSWQAALCAAGAIVALFAAWRWLVKGVWIGFVRASLIGAALIYLGAFQFALPAMRPIWLSERMTEIAEPYRACLAERLGERPALGAAGYHEPSLVFLAGTDTQLLGAEDAGKWIASTPGALAWVRERQVKLEKHLLFGEDYAPTDDQSRFRRGMRSSGAGPIALAETRGFNYTKGRLVELTLYARADDPALVACRAALDGAEPGDGGAQAGASE